MPFVYFIQAGDENGPIKIGFSIDPYRRMEELQTMHAEQLFLLGVVECADETAECALHRRFARICIRGEWHRPTAELLQVVADSQHIDTARSTAAHQRTDEALHSKPAAMRALGWKRASTAHLEIRRRINRRNAIPRRM